MNYVCCSLITTVADSDCGFCGFLDYLVYCQNFLLIQKVQSNKSRNLLHSAFLCEKTDKGLFKAADNQCRWSLDGSKILTFPISLFCQGRSLSGFFTGQIHYDSPRFLTCSVNHGLVLSMICEYSYCFKQIWNYSLYTAPHNTRNHIKTCLIYFLS